MSPEIEHLYKQAEEAEKSRNFEAAVACYQKIVDADPADDHAHYALAHLHAVLGRPRQVVQQYLHLAGALAGKGHAEESLEACAWAISIEPSGEQPRLKLIELLENQGNEDEAEKHALILSRIFSEAGHGEKSIALLEHRVMHNPDNPEIGLHLGETHIKQGHIPEGIAVYKTIAEELLRRRDYSRALDVFKRIKALKNKDIENLLALGELFYQLGRMEEAQAEFRLVLHQDWDHAGALCWLGLIAKAQGAWSEARAAFRKMVDIEPENALGRKSYAEVCEFLGDPEAAIEHYMAAGELYEKSGDRQKAVDLYQNALYLSPEQPDAVARLQALGAPAVPRPHVVAQERRSGDRRKGDRRKTPRPEPKGEKTIPETSWRRSRFFKQSDADGH